MSADVEDSVQHDTASLVSGIFCDLQNLFELQLHLTRLEIEAELRQASAAGAILFAGVAHLLLAALMMCFGVVQFLHWLASPPEIDPAWLPLWVCHAIVAIVLVLIGGILTYAGRSKLRSIEMCHNPVAELLQEPVE